MEGKIQTSFIPKKPLVESGKRIQRPHSLFSFIAFIIFGLTLLTWGGVYVWAQSLQKNITDLNTELTAKQEAIDPTLVDSLVRLNSRIEAGKKILASHLAVSQIFPLIADHTLQSVQFNTFSYDDTSGKPTLSLAGVAPSFSSLALQSDAFSSQSYLQNQIFSGLGLDQTGGVTFKFDASIDPSALSYSQSLAASQTTPAATPAVLPLTAPAGGATTTPPATGNPQ